MVTSGIRPTTIWQTSSTFVPPRSHRTPPLFQSFHSPFRSPFRSSFQPVFLRREVRDLFALFLVICFTSIVPYNNLRSLFLASLVGMSYVVVRWYYFAYRIGLRASSRYLLSVYVIEAALLALLWTIAHLLRDLAPLSAGAEISLVAGLMLLGLLLLLGGEAVLGRRLSLLTATEAACAPQVETALSRMSDHERWFLHIPALPAAEEQSSQTA